MSPTSLTETDPGFGLRAEEEVPSRPARQFELPPEIDSLGGYRLIALRLIWTDALCLVAALATTHVIVFKGGPMTLGHAAIIAIGVPIWLLIFRAFGLYHPHRLSGIEEFRRVLSATAVGMVAVLLASFWSAPTFSRTWIAWSVMIALSLELGARLLWRAYVWRLKTNGRLVMRTLIVGSRDQSDGLLAALALPGSGFSPVGFLDLSWPLFSERALSPVELSERIRRTIRQLQAECLFVAAPSATQENMLALAQAVRQEGVEFRLHAPLAGFLSSRLSVLPMGPSGLAFSLHAAQLSRTQRFLKRAFDLVFASLGLLLLLPFLLVVAALIKFTSAGTALFRQERVTKGGRTFRIFKFRTMSTGGLSPDEDSSKPFFKLKDDPRLTRVGRFLRRLSIDELPQLLNVVLGDMSLVGPRPLPAEQVAANLEALELRHEVRAGVTGWWQINGRSDIGPEEAVRMDRFYIENWSLTLDVYILLRTAWVLTTRKGAY